MSAERAKCPRCGRRAVTGQHTKRAGRKGGQCVPVRERA